MYYDYEVFRGLRKRMTKTNLLRLLPAFCALATIVSHGFAQTDVNRQQQRIRTVSIPISIFTKQELKEGQAAEYVQAERLIVREDREEQEILSIRSIADAPLALAILVQEDLSSDFNLQIRDLKEFITKLPKGSRVMVAYVRGGNLQIRHKFSDDLEAAAASLRIVTSNSAGAPRSPYDGVIDALERFDALPAGRRAILLVSDGLDVSSGVAGSTPGQSLDLDRAILRAQRKSVAVYSFYSPASLTESGDSRLILNGQGSLQKLSDETGGRAFFQGSTAPISFDPFFKDLRVLLNRQFLLSYVSTHMKKGYHRVEVISTNPEVRIEHPRGYYYR
jgi:VWFA-related protein